MLGQVWRNIFGAIGDNLTEFTLDGLHQLVVQFKKGEKLSLSDFAIKLQDLELGVGKQVKYSFSVLETGVILLKVETPVEVEELKKESVEEAPKQRKRKKEDTDLEQAKEK